MASGAIQRFGARYGRKTRHRLDAIETLQKAKYECPSCNRKSAKRVSKGIWQCTKCLVKFASGAYSVRKIPSVIEEKIGEELEHFNIEE